LAVWLNLSLSGRVKMNRKIKELFVFIEKMFMFLWFGVTALYFVGILFGFENRSLVDFALLFGFAGFFMFWARHQYESH
jgi:hypothetical protein